MVAQDQVCALQHLQELERMLRVHVEATEAEPWLLRRVPHRRHGEGRGGDGRLQWVHEGKPKVGQDLVHAVCCPHPAPVAAHRCAILDLHRAELHHAGYWANIRFKPLYVFQPLPHRVPGGTAETQVKSSIIRLPKGTVAWMLCPTSAMQVSKSRTPAKCIPEDTVA